MDGLAELLALGGLLEETLGGVACRTKVSIQSEKGLVSVV